MNKIFLIADPHFGHNNIIKHCDRPFNNTDEMDAYIIKQHNSLVGRMDKVYILGDFSFHNQNKTKRIVESLSGYKILVMGNHDRDRSHKWWIECGFDEVSKYPIIVTRKNHTNSGIVLSHEPFSTLGDINIHGHIHNTISDKVTINNICVSVEVTNYTPVNLKAILTQCGIERGATPEQIKQMLSAYCCS